MKKNYIDINRLITVMPFLKYICLVFIMCLSGPMLAKDVHRQTAPLINPHLIKVPFDLQQMVQHVLYYEARLLTVPSYPTVLLEVQKAHLPGNQYMETLGCHFIGQIGLYENQRAPIELVMGVCEYEGVKKMLMSEGRIYGEDYLMGVALTHLFEPLGQDGPIFIHFQ